MSENVIKLEFRSPHMTAEGGINFLACSNCRNKTYTLTEDNRSSFPMLKCAACGQEMGRMGWYHDDDPQKGVPA